MSQASPNPVAVNPDLEAWLKSPSGSALPPPAPANAEAEADAPSEASEGWTPIVIDPSEIRVLWEEGWHPVEITAAGPHTGKESGKESLKLTYRCFAGSESGKFRDDYLPREGGGRVKTYRVAESIDLRDKGTGEVKITHPDITIGRKMWIKIIHKPDSYENALGEKVDRTKDEIEFPNGYAHISAFELPMAGDLFAEPGQPDKSQKPAPPKPPAAEAPPANTPAAGATPSW